MPITTGDAGNRDVLSVYVGDGGGNRTIREIWVGDGGSNRLLFVNFSITAPNVFDTQAVGIPAGGDSTVVITGGTAPYSVSWVQLSGSGYTRSGTSTATLTVEKTSTTLGAVSGTERVTVTDAGGLVESVDITIDLENA